MPVKNLGVDVPNHPDIPIPNITVEEYDEAEERTRKSQSLRVTGRSQSLLDLRKAEKNVYKKTRQMSVSLTGTIEDISPCICSHTSRSETQSPSGS
jgi:hypothetical protein